MRTIGVVLDEGFQVMAMAALSAFEFANIVLRDDAYRTIVMWETGGLVRSSEGDAECITAKHLYCCDCGAIHYDYATDAMAPAMLKARRANIRTGARVAARLRPESKEPIVASRAADPAQASQRKCGRSSAVHELSSC